jgi:lipopolysaccharide transport system permease protein
MPSRNLPDKMICTIYTPVSNLKLSWFQALRKAKNDSRQYSHFIWQMTKTSFLSSYKNSSLGIVWALILPLVAPMVYVLMQIMGIFSGEMDFPRALYVVAGFFFWNLWAETLLSTMECIGRNARFVQKNSVPLLVLFFGNLGTVAFNLIPTSALFIALVFHYDIGNHIFLLLIPVLSFFILLLALGIGMILSIFAVFSDDFTNSVKIIIRYLMFASGVIFPIPISDSILGKLLQWNPLLSLVDSSRNMVIFGTGFDTNFLLALIGLSIFLFMTAVKKVVTLEDKILSGIN